MSVSRAYAGIGSRRTPREIQTLMTALAGRLCRDGYVLRTGGAPGADAAFLRGVTDPRRVEIYLPWPTFNGHLMCRFSEPSDEARHIARQFHPRWGRGMSPSVMALIARNTHQILGFDCDSPSAFVLCWTPDGAETETDEGTGGTGQAIRIAVARGIPVWNLARDERRRQVVEDFGAMLSVLR